MGFNDLGERFDPALKLPIKGKIYRFEPLDADTGVFLQTVTTLSARHDAGGTIDPSDVEQISLDEDDPRDIWHRVLGDAFDEMKADGLDWEWVKLVTSTIIIWTVNDRDAAEKYWNAGGHLPKGPKPPQDRKAPAKSGRPASTATTKPRKKAARRSPGGSSSNTGA